MDALARDYLLLALRVGRLEDGIVDAYFGPPDLRAEAEEGPVDAALLADVAADLRDRVSAGPGDRQRARWLDRQLVALEAICRRIANEKLSYVEEVARCLDAAPEATPAAAYAEVHRALDELLPPGAGLRERVEARRQRLTVPPEHLAEVVEWLTDEIRRACVTHFPAPAGETMEVSFVTGQPWSAYNWYDGGLRSRIEINTDLPARAPDLISLIAHEAFPGHHLEHSWKETRLVREQGRAEATIQLINTPEAYISEGLAELGARFVIEPELWQQLLVGVCERSGVAPPADAEAEWRTTQALRGLRATGADAALLLHAERRPREEVLAFIVDTGLRSPAEAAKSLEFIEHPLWRTYVFSYSGGERLLERWCGAAGEPAAQRARFFRLLTEQLTPSAIAEELADEPRVA